ncbi:MAG: hypothetical protein KGQ49_07065, partial [Verrucomicrobia bacterium]|nr:hypothetical protein [Verrucomicrobiota bacterium]
RTYAQAYEYYLKLKKFSESDIAGERYKLANAFYHISRQGGTPERCTQYVKAHVDAQFGNTPAVRLSSLVFYRLHQWDGAPSRYQMVIDTCLNKYESCIPEAFRWGIAACLRINPRERVLQSMALLRPRGGGLARHVPQ